MKLMEIRNPNEVRWMFAQIDYDFIRGGNFLKQILTILIDFNYSTTNNA